MKRSARQSAYLEAMGITQWVSNETPAATRLDSADLADEFIAGHETRKEQAQPVEFGEPIESLDWEGLEKRVAACTQCDLHKKRSQAVLGVGNLNADWLIIGEAPGEQEDIQGEPFVGRAGLLLNNMLKAMGLERGQIYIANVVKCRPPGNRDPHADEIASCHAYLQRQIDLIQPKILLVSGRVAAQSLLQTDTPVGKLRGKIHQYPGTDIPLIVTYHPAYLLRKPSEKAKAWQDLKLALSALPV